MTLRTSFDVPVAGCIARQQIARPAVMPGIEERIAHDAGRFAADQNPSHCRGPPTKPVQVAGARSATWIVEADREHGAPCSAMTSMRKQLRPSLTIRTKRAGRQGHDAKAAEKHAEKSVDVFMTAPSAACRRQTGKGPAARSFWNAAALANNELAAGLVFMRERLGLSLQLGSDLPSETCPLTRW